MKNAAKIIAVAVLAFMATTVYADHSQGLSALNHGVRVFEDAIWLGAFTLMITTGWLLRKITRGTTSGGYSLLVLAGCSGMLWKSLGAVKRIGAINEPVWLFSIAREICEGFTGVALASAFSMIVWAVAKLIRRENKNKKAKLDVEISQINK